MSNGPEGGETLSLGGVLCILGIVEAEEITEESVGSRIENPEESTFENEELEEMNSIGCPPSSKVPS